MAHTLETGQRPVELTERAAENIWTEERIAELTQLWVEEALPASGIAQRMGISRSTVMGKINRLGLLRHLGSLTPSTISPREEEPQEPVPPTTLLATEIAAVDDPRLGKHPTIFELRASHCRFPLGGSREPAVFFCGKPAELPKPYCRDCCQRAYTAGRPKTQ